MARAPSPPVSLTVRTATMRTEYKGDLPGALDQLLIACGSGEQRLAALEQLKATHERIVKWEAEREAKNG